MREFENWRGGGAGGQGGQQAFTDIADQPVQLAEDTAIDLMNFDMNPEEENKIKMKKNLKAPGLGHMTRNTQPVTKSSLPSSPRST